MTLLDDLHAAGFEVATVMEVRNDRARYREAVPIIASWLGRIDEPALAQGATRALASSWAKAAYDDLVDALWLYTERGRSDHPDAAKWRSAAWAVGNSIDTVWNDTRFDELAAYVTDPANGRSRQQVLDGMRKSKRPEAGDIAARLLDDDEVVLHAFSVLLKHPTEHARPALERRLSQPVRGPRARKVLARLDERKPA